MPEFSCPVSYVLNGGLGGLRYPKFLAIEWDLFQSCSHLGIGSYLGYPEVSKKPFLVQSLQHYEGLFVSSARLFVVRDSKGDWYSYPEHLYSLRQTGYCMRCAGYISCWTFLNIGSSPLVFNRRLVQSILVIYATPIGTPSFMIIIDKVTFVIE